MNEYDVARSVILSAPERPIVVSLGAYRGEDDAAFCAAGRVFDHIMVEPDPDNIDAIRTLPKSISHRKVIAAAINARSGYTPFYRSRDSRDGATGSGSILQPTGHLEHFPSIQFDRVISVSCMTLDELFDIYNLQRIDLLWVDIQGAERAMITGGRCALARTRHLIMEAESVEFYEDQTLRPDLLAALPDWELVQDFGFNVYLRNSKWQI